MHERHAVAAIDHPVVRQGRCLWQGEPDFVAELAVFAAAVAEHGAVVPGFGLIGVELGTCIDHRTRIIFGDGGEIPFRFAAAEESDAVGSPDLKLSRTLPSRTVAVRMLVR